MSPTCSPCRAIDRTFILSFSIPEIEEISEEKIINEEIRIERYNNPIIIALRMEKIIREGEISRAELSRIIGISSERVTQYMNLLRLAPEVKEKIKVKGEKMRISERKLRRLINKRNKEQIKIIEGMMM